MKSWLDELQGKMSQVDLGSRTVPHGEVTERDHVVGVANDELKQLFIVARKLQHQAASVAADGMMGSLEDRRVAETQASIFASEASTILDIFWLTARRAFPDLAEKDNIGVRENWEVVWTEKPQRQSLMGMLSEAISSVEIVGRDDMEDVDTPPQH